MPCPDWPYCYVVICSSGSRNVYVNVADFALRVPLLHLVRIPVLRTRVPLLHPILYGLRHRLSCDLARLPIQLVDNTAKHCRYALLDRPSVGRLDYYSHLQKLSPKLLIPQSYRLWSKRKNGIFIEPPCILPVLSGLLLEYYHSGLSTPIYASLSRSLTSSYSAFRASSSATLGDIGNRCHITYLAYVHTKCLYDEGI